MVETISTGDFMVYVFIFNHLWDDGDQCLGTWLNHHVGGFFPWQVNNFNVIDPWIIPFTSLGGHGVIIPKRGIPSGKLLQFAIENGP